MGRVRPIIYLVVAGMWGYVLWTLAAARNA
jgi:hypothetical protein